MKKRWGSMLSVVLVAALFSTSGQVLAADPVTKSSAEELFGSSSRDYNTEAYGLPEITVPEKINSLVLSQKEVALEHNGESVFVDAVGELAEGSFINLGQKAVWSSDNTDVVFADAGRLLAIGAGKATVTVEYGGIKEVIEVSVAKTLDLQKEVETLEATKVGTISPFGFSASDRTTVVDKAKGMVNMTWTPTKDVRGWKNNTTFKANTKYTGMPYSQTENQKDKDGFTKAMSATDFYTNYTRFDIIMPRYGNDCSGFVSFAWGISRQTTSGFVSGIQDGTYAKVGTYNSSTPTKADLKAAYKKLAAGDAVVKSGHTFLIASNDTTNSKVYAYEQTPNLAVYTTWTYESMGSDGYMPYTKK
ncbi:hypothetical protein [Gorillibacterium sp. CAU 1737]|uniref:hypothetical protein n=1 Tax=Gorillibacterium sp. CAU 1737 TaxID=3140362 RepID=UPI003260EDB6